MEILYKGISRSKFFKKYVLAIYAICMVVFGLVLIAIANFMSNQLDASEIPCRLQGLLSGGESTQCFLGTNLLALYQLPFGIGVIAVIGGGLISLVAFYEYADMEMWRYNKAIEQDPNNPHAYNDRAAVWKKRKEFDKAIADYTKAIERDPNNPYAYNIRGNTFIAKKELDKALVDYNKAIELDPQFAPAYNGRGVILREKGEFEKALADYEKAVALSPTDRLYKQNLEKLKAKMKLVK